MAYQLIDFLASPAFADTGSQAAPGGNYSLFFMMGFIVLFMYFAVIRPQNKRAREMQNLISQLAEGDEVLTSGGVIGRITKIQEQYLILELQEGHLVCMQKSAISSVLPRGTLKSLMG